MRHWRATAAVLLLAASGLAVGSAASAAFGATSLGAGATTVPRCTSAALSVVPVLSGSVVSSVTVANLPSACGGAALSVTVVSGASSASGSSTVPAGGGSVSVAIPGGPALGTATRIDALLVGP